MNLHEEDVQRQGDEVEDRLGASAVRDNAPPSTHSTMSQSQTQSQQSVMTLFSSAANVSSNTNLNLRLNTTLKAYITLVTNDAFVIGAQVLAYSLRQVKADYPYYAMVTCDVSAKGRATLAAAGYHLVLVAPLGLPSGQSGQVHVSSWASVGYTKLRLFELTQFDLLLYIDADCLVVKNLDHLLRELPASITFAAAPDTFPPDRFNAGVLLLRPNLGIFHSLLRRMGRQMTSYDSGDTGLLNAFFPQWYQTKNSVGSQGVVLSSETRATAATTPLQSCAERNASYRDGLCRLSFGYNALRTLQWFTKTQPGYWKAIDPLYIIHYCSSPKPWEDMERRRGGPLEQQWFQAYEAMMAEMNEREKLQLTSHSQASLEFIMTDAGALLPAPSVHQHLDKLTPFQALQAYLAIYLDKTPFGEFTLKRKGRRNICQEEGKDGDMKAESSMSMLSGSESESDAATATSPPSTPSTPSTPAGAIRPLCPGVWVSRDREERFMAFTRRRLQVCLMDSVRCVVARNHKRQGIPKRLHQIWLGGPLPQEYEAWCNSWKTFHPEAAGWTYKMWTEVDFRHFPYCETLTDATSLYLASHLRALLPRCQNVAQRSDLFRLDLLWTFGGLYVDTDFECLADFSPFHAGGPWAHHIDFYAGFSNVGVMELNNGLMGSVPQQGLVAKLISSIDLPDPTRSRRRSSVTSMPSFSSTSTKHSSRTTHESRSSDLPSPQHQTTDEPSPCSPSQPMHSHASPQESHATSTATHQPSAFSLPPPSIPAVGLTLQSAMEVICTTGPAHFTTTAVQYVEDWFERRQRYAAECASASCSRPSTPRKSDDDSDDASPRSPTTPNSNSPPFCVSVPDPPLLFFPAQCFYPLPNNMRHLQRIEDKHAFIVPCSFAIHHWEASWQKGMTHHAGEEDADITRVRGARSSIREDAHTLRNLVLALQNLRAKTNHEAATPSHQPSYTAPLTHPTSSSSSSSSSSRILEDNDRPIVSIAEPTQASTATIMAPELVAKIASFL